MRFDIFRMGSRHKEIVGNTRSLLKQQQQQAPLIGNSITSMSTTSNCFNKQMKKEISINRPAVLNKNLTDLTAENYFK